MLFVLSVRGGSETAVQEGLRLRGYKSYCPLQLYEERRRGVWQQVQRVVFAGYVFVECDEITPADWHRIAACNGFVRLISRCPLSPAEDEYIRLLCLQERIGISRGYVSNGALHITEGFAKQFEHKIVKYNRRGRRATAEVTMYGEKCRITFSVIFDSPPASGDTLPDCEKI